MKTLFVLALISLVVTNVFGQLDTTCSQGCRQCQQQQQQWLQQMNTCSAFLQQCGPVTAPFVRSPMWQASSCQMMQQQCCQQLAQISEQARCQAVSSVAQSIMQQQQGQSFDQPQQQVQFEIMRMVLHTLPSMCTVYIPKYCTTIPCSTIIPTPYSIPMTSAGGACC